MTLRLPLDVLDASASTSEGVGAVYDTGELGQGLCATRHLIVEEVILGLLAESGVPSGVTVASVALTCTAPHTALWLLFVTLGFLIQLFLEVEVLGRLAVGTAGNAGHSVCQEVGVSTPRSVLMSEFSVSCLASLSSTRTAVSWT